MKWNWAWFGVAGLIIFSLLISSCLLGGSPSADTPGGPSNLTRGQQGIAYYQISARTSGNPPDATFMLDAGPTAYFSGTADRDVSQDHTTHAGQPELPSGDSQLHVAPFRFEGKSKFGLGSSAVPQPPRQDTPSQQQSDHSTADLRVSLRSPSKAQRRLRNQPDAPVEGSPVVPLRDTSPGKSSLILPVISEVHDLSQNVLEQAHQPEAKLQESKSSLAIARERLPETFESYPSAMELSDIRTEGDPILSLEGRSLVVSPPRPPMVSETKTAREDLSEPSVSDTPELRSERTSLFADSVELSAASEVKAGAGDAAVLVPPGFEPVTGVRTRERLGSTNRSETKNIIGHDLSASIVLPADNSPAMAREIHPEKSAGREGRAKPLDPVIITGPHPLLSDASPTESIVRFAEITETEVNAKEESIGSLLDDPEKPSTKPSPAAIPSRLASSFETPITSVDIGGALAQGVTKIKQFDGLSTRSPVRPLDDLEFEPGIEDPLDSSAQDTLDVQDMDTPLYAAMVQVPEESKVDAVTKKALALPAEVAAALPSGEASLSKEPVIPSIHPVEAASPSSIAPVSVPVSPTGSMQMVVGQNATSQPAVAPAASVPALSEAPQSAPETPELVSPELPDGLPGLGVRISVDLRQMDILAVMKFLAKEGNLNIVTGKNVGGRISLTLKDVTVQDILDITALSYELAYVVQNGIIHVMTEADYTRLFGAPFADQRKVRTLQLEHADANAVAALLNNMKSAVGRVIGDPQTRTLVLIDVPEKLESMVMAAKNMDQATKLQTQVFELRYSKAVDIQPEVEKVLTPNVGGVRLDKRTNTLVVTDLAPRMNDVQRVIRAFDRKTREVNIESKIIQVRLDDKYQMGVNWEVLFQQLSDLRLQGTFPIAPPIGAAGPVGRLTVGTLADDDFTAVIDLLQTVGKTNVLSTPQIAVVENEEAKILVGTREAFVTSVVTQTQQAATTAEEVTFVDVGVSLTAVPTINREGYVTMKIKPEVSSVSRTLTTANGNQIPIVQTSTAESTVMVKDGVTIIIAGLIEDQTLQKTNKVPILGDIPFLGAAFRNKSDEVIKSELVIFLTPTIISGKDSVASVPASVP